METARLGHHLLSLKHLALTPGTHVLLSVLALAINDILKYFLVKIKKIFLKLMNPGFSILGHYLEQSHVGIMEVGFRLVAVLHCIAVLSGGFS